MKFFLIILFLSCGINMLVNGISHFKINGKQCLDQPVEYQCTVTGSGLQVLTWRVYTDNGTLFGSPHHYLSSNVGSILSIGGVFTVEQLSTSPLISNISFTVQSSINGYTIICEDGNTLNNENITINISGVIEPPKNISFTSSKSAVITTWTQPMSQCVSSYSITSNATNSIITTTDASVDIPLAGLSPGVYCVSVATVDTANRPGEHSEKCVSLKAPPPPVHSYELLAANSLDYAIATVSLIFNLSSTIPVLTAGYIVVGSQEFKGELTYYNNQITIAEFSITLERGVNYSIMCFGENVLGNGSILTFDIYVDQSEVLPTPLIPHYTSIGSTTASTSVSTSQPISTIALISTSCPLVTCLSSSVSAGISVAITVPVTAVITAIVTVIILYLYQRRVNKQSSSIATPPKYPISTNEVEMKGNTAYGQVQHSDINSTTATVSYDTVHQQ